MKDDIVFTINGEEISLSDLNNKMNSCINRSELTAWVLGTLAITISISIAFGIFSYSIVDKQNEILREQNKEIKEQNKEIKDQTILIYELKSQIDKLK